MKERAILIADAGGTSIGWSLLDRRADSVPERLSTQGMNILMASSEALDALLSPVVRWASEICGRDGLLIDELFFYGAGCSTSESRGFASSRLLGFFPAAIIHIESDMLGAARSVLQDRRGIACILGTGSNSCLYDGTGIVHKVPSLGYILGDDGSGAALGRRFLRSVIQRRLPERICADFFEENGLTVERIIDNVYRRPLPNRFLGSFAPWILAHIDDRTVREMVLEEFRDFFRFNILAYPEAQSLPIALCGSIAANFEALLREVAAEHKIEISTAVADPMEGLIRYHRTHKSL